MKLSRSRDLPEWRSGRRVADLAELESALLPKYSLLCTVVQPHKAFDDRRRPLFDLGHLVLDTL